MTHLQVLASSVRPLAEVLVDALRRQANPLTRLRSSSVEESDTDDSQPNLPLDDDDESHQDDAPNALRPDEVAVAVLLGRAFDDRRDILASLQDTGTVTVLEIPGADYVNVIDRILRRCVLGTDANVLDGDSLQGASAKITAPRTIALFVRRDEPMGKRSSAESEAAEFAAAVQRRCAVIGVAAEPERLLPRDLVRLADHRIVVPALDAGAVAAVTGRHPDPIDEDLGKRTTLESLVVAVHADLGAGRCVERLRRLLVAKEADATPLLSDLHGLGQAKEWGLNLIHDLKEYRAGRLPWSAVDRGCLLSGMPGTFKTGFARALAREAGSMHFVATSYAQWQSYKEGHLGHVTQALRASFADAARNRPAILFIDEIDTIQARGMTKRDNEWWTAINNALLEQIDGFERREGIVIIAACNDPSRLDPALVRSGRLDKHVRIPMPDTPALAGILRTHLGGDLKDVNLLPAAVAARGGTGADIERWVRIARRTARIAERPLTLDDVVAAIRDGEPELPPAVRRRIAYHESGHTVALIALGIAQPHSLSIHAAGGLAEFSPGPIEAQTRVHVEHHMTCLLAGRAAEELVLGQVTAGAGGSEGSDLSRASQLALRIETSFGLGDLGPVWIGDAAGQRALLLHDGLSQTVRRTLDTAYAAAKTLLIGNRDTLDHLAEALLARGYLDRGEIEAVLAKAPPRMIEATDAPAVQAAQPPDPVDGRGEINLDTAADANHPTSGTAAYPSS